MSAQPSSSTAMNQYKTFILEKKIKHDKKVKRKTLKNFVRSRLRNDDLKVLKYKQFEPLYEMWCEYFSTILANSNKQTDERILKVDFHGSLLMVSDADNPSQIGLHGIVARETRQTFQLITKDDRLIVIPKQGTVFRFVFEGKVYTIYGDAFRFVLNSILVF
ncbi:unnamed protein product [Anisakis simplex]|uniref:Ribonuclease P protein subunit p29 n=1 Tax=Anisakis simplex TaxID=6269 RepID=A0A0M3KDL4_ANISI|nr:unnamed protein product [Anisakis simplex]